MKMTIFRILPVCVAAVLAGQGFAADKTEKPQTKAARPRMEVCFVLDTTGSMSGLIEGAKQKIWAIANEMVSAKPTPELRLGLIGYRDRGDAYVVKSFDLTNDIDAVYANLRGFSAGGGGDTPESVNEALNEAVTKLAWSTDRSVLKIIFLVGDAPPHMDYVNAPKYPEICQAAMKKDLIINTVQCGNIPETAPVWKEIAKLSEGNYAAIAQEGGMVAIATPMDAELAELNRKVGATLVAYGLAPARLMVAAKGGIGAACPAPCVEGSAAAAESDRAYSRANAYAWVADVAMPVGVVAAAAGVFVLVTSGKPAPSTSRARPRLEPAPVALGHGAVLQLSQPW